MRSLPSFNPEINIREITQNGRYYENGQWVTTQPLEIHKDLTYPNIGPRDSYLLYHEELESLVKNFPTIKRARFWMTFGQEYLTHLRVIQNIGMARIDEVDYNGVKIVPLQFLKAVLPNPQDLGENYEGETSIGCRIRGLKDGKERTYYVYNNCSHQEAYKETGMQGVSYTTGVPAMMITCVAIYDIQILHFIEIMFGSICSINTTYPRIGNPNIQTAQVDEYPSI